ncbi:MULTISPECIES: hypothetical protein [unclassified Pseudomonas]|jgi:hypothetical protein|uniref:hypothetical protein n=1 Tax=unclassified Pseudomonas TaxID=196821 RepID=UPI0008AE30C4|nr:MULTISPECIES: hypothetical protein [unclassified Pseudomonas]MBT9570541.1 hypothetical protein [Pseudomonas umsongensis]OHC26047.1 MAG: hypothetical protein A3J25_03170 [Pseudomonadales bacterium RIFCSPLOWO2_02_FULL_63_210]HDS0958749.1 hypothetical protein [Pseudomonas putida]PMZ92983.1 hypothetical protein C1X61_00345 [Pseudomonas sp. FW215-T2]PNB39415.1 hypothetical protein C1X63_02845 [Pseudomonas sp. FW305-131]
MPSSELPPFEPVTLDELRRIWSAHDDPDIRRLALEVARYRRVLAEVDKLYKTVHQSWRAQVGGDLVALHLLKQIMYHERMRLP